jgi:hypothetical protein
MLVVHFMGPADHFNISIVAAGKQFEPLVYDDLMYQKISKPIHGYTKTYTNRPVIALHAAEHNAKPAGYGKNQKESIIFFEKSFFFLVMVFMQIPQKPMHHIPMGKPCNWLHY